MNKSHFLTAAVASFATLLVVALTTAFKPAHRQLEPEATAYRMKAKGFSDAPAALDMNEESGAVAEADVMKDERADKKKSRAPMEQTMMALGGIGARGGPGAPAAAPAAPRAMMAKETQGSGASESPSETATRAWFPETFLFEPLVVTGADGRASVPVKVPDRLTSWRVLALAHSRQGAQAGAETTFVGTLPSYVDPVVPPTLVFGDTLRLPIQMVNTTGKDLAATLKVSAQGATVSAAGGSVRIPAGGSTVQFANLSATSLGPASLSAALVGTDAVERTFDVRPSGRPVTVTQGGTLATERTFPLEGPANPIKGSEEIRLDVFPGALALLRSELAASVHRGSVADDAYLLLLSGRAPALLQTLGWKADAAAVRDLALLATQRALRHARAPNLATASVLTEAALAHPDSPVLSRLSERLGAQVAASQRPDGTCQGENGWTLQRLLVATSDCVAAVRAGQSPAAVRRASNVVARASGAVERNVGRVDDAYTAAALVASGAAQGAIVERLQKVIVAGLSKSDFGTQRLVPSKGVVRADGQVPSVEEATALAALATLAMPGGPAADLGSHLLSSYSPWRGWGDGRANLFALRAMVELFKDGAPASVRIELLRDGKAVTEGTFDASKLRDIVQLRANAPGLSGAHSWTVRATPAVPGLGFSFALFAYVPWKAEPPSGLELTVAPPKSLTVGSASALEVAAAAPAGASATLRLAVPAGVQVDRPALEALMASRTILGFELEDGAATVRTKPFASGAALTFSLRVIPTLAGRMTPQASSIALASGASKRFVPPQAWTISP